MDPERWNRIERLFHECLERAADARAAHLEAACAGDIELRAEVEALLASDEQAGLHLESVIQDGAGLALAHSWIGRRLGPYRIVREIGHGGMGAVFRAARADEQFEKQVAIKVVLSGLEAEPLLRSFRQERQILAQLEHPYIARLLDGGATAEGVPYLVMEYVEGQPIVQYCDERKLPIRERLALFVKVCAAVQYAHQNLVVHRDLKPGNILVTAAGEPKLLDFGVAKLLAPQAAEPTLTAYLPFTPHYASPEQVQGGPITTATDVYSLGALLYELLAGVHPYAFRNLTAEEIVRTVSQEEPEGPSVALKCRAPADVASLRAAAPDKLARQLAGDLDNIVLKAMRKDPRERYASAGQVADDVRRHLEGLPVVARKPTVRYRTAKFLRRYRVAAAAAATLLVSMLAFTLLTVFESQRTARERDRAARISDFLVGLFNVSDPSEARGKTVTAREILDQGAARIERELKSEPEQRAALLETMGRVYLGLGSYERAAALLEQAVAIRRRIHAPVPELASALAALGRVRSARGEYAAAEKLFGEVLSMRSQLSPAHSHTVTEVLSSLGSLYQSTGRTAAAERAYRECLQIHRASGRPTADLAVALNNLGSIRLEKNDFAGAEPLFREALAVYRSTVGPDHPQVANTLNNLGRSLYRKGDYAGAEPVYREALELARKVQGERHPVYAVHLLNFGVFLHEKGDDSEAEKYIRQALAIQREVLPPGHLNLAAAEIELGKVLIALGRPRDAEPVLRDGMLVFARRLPKDNARRVSAEVAYGKSLVQLGQFRVAEPYLADKYPVYKRIWGERSERTQNLLKVLVALYQGLKQADRSAEYEALRRTAAAAARP